MLLLKMDNCRYSIFNPEDKLSEKREFSRTVDNDIYHRIDENVEKVIVYRIDKKIDECKKEIEEYEIKIKELKKNLKIYDKDKQDMLEMIQKYK